MDITREPLCEFRCPHCGKLLFKGSLLIGTVEIKCGRCGAVPCYDSPQRAESPIDIKQRALS
jgi:phage FluMu protein Com